MKYQRPSVNCCEEPMFGNVTTQYIVKITVADCPGEAGGQDLQIAVHRDGDEFVDEMCMGSDPLIGEQADMKCLETGNQNYHTVIVNVTLGSMQCGVGQHAAIIYATSDPGIPPVCTKTSEIIDGVDACHIQ